MIRVRTELTSVFLSPFFEEGVLQKKCDNWSWGREAIKSSYRVVIAGSTGLIFGKNNAEDGSLFCGDNDCKYVDGCKGFDKWGTRNRNGSMTSSRLGIDQNWYQVKDLFEITCSMLEDWYSNYPIHCKLANKIVGYLLFVPSTIKKLPQTVLDETRLQTSWMNCVYNRNACSDGIELLT